MKNILCLLLIFITLLASASEVIVDKPQLTLSGVFKDYDGRVSNRDFSVVFDLKSDGNLTGYFESWLEKRYADKPPQLVIFKTELSGQWSVKDKVFLISLKTDSGLPDFRFKEFNGMSVKIVKATPNKPSEATPKPGAPQ